MILSSLRRPVRMIGLSSDEIIRRVAEDCPEVEDVLAHTVEMVPWCKRQVHECEAACIYWLASRLEGDQALEIGTAWGYSAAVIAQAMPEAKLVTLNPKPSEVRLAREHLAGWPNVRVVEQLSAEYLDEYDGPLLSLVFVDGDHRRAGVLLDCQWFNWLAVGGLILFHDYSDAGTRRPCPSVKQVVDAFSESLGRPPDVLIIDDGGVGIAGFHRRPEEVWLG